VDDGCPGDWKAADLLHKYGLPATFYIPAKNPEREVMGASEIREIGREFEIGGHTYNHTGLRTLADGRALEEIVSGKKWLEDLLGCPVHSFCYPQGKFNGRTPDLVKQAGFIGGRTCLFNLHEFPLNPFLWGLTTHAGDHSKTIQVRHALLEGNYRGMANFFTIYRGATNWQQHFLNGLQHVAENGGIAHLYFHSWEIEENHQWNELEAVFQRIVEAASRYNFIRATNGELFALWGQAGSEISAVPEKTKLPVQ
jgi:peptidoglycan/xylan/chitin deacetylase (PgdA/CDA1 family)